MQDFKTWKQDSIILAQDFVLKLVANQNHLVQENNNIYVYDGLRKYDLFDEKLLGKKLHKFLVDHGATSLWNSSRKKDIYSALLADEKLVPVVAMNAYENLLNLRNGVFDLDTLTLSINTHKHYFTTYVDVDYDPKEIACQTFDDTLGTIFTNNDGTPDYETIENIIRLGGYLLYPKNKLKKMFMFLGEGANGKSMVIDTYGLFFPEQFKTYLTLEHMSSDNFTRSRLLTSRLNISTEAKQSGVDSEEIKKIISGEGITINPKYGEPINFHPTTKIIIASNTRPSFNDTSHGIFRRLYLVEFPNRFVEKDDYARYSEPEKCRIFLAKDPDQLMDSIRAEASAILNKFLIGLIDLRNNAWVLGESKASSAVKMDYQQDMDRLGSFLTDHYYSQPGAHDDVNFFPTSLISTTEILAHYREWYRENVAEKSAVLHTKTLGQKIKQVFRLESMLINSKRGYALYAKTALDNIYEQSLPLQPTSNGGEVSGGPEVGGSTQDSIFSTGTGVAIF